MGQKPCEALGSWWLIRTSTSIEMYWRHWENYRFNQWPFQDPKLEVPTIYKAYVREYPHKIWPYYMVQYLQFRILEFPLIQVDNMKVHREVWESSSENRELLELALFLFHFICNETRFRKTISKLESHSIPFKPSGKSPFLMGKSTISMCHFQ